MLYEYLHDASMDSRDNVYDLRKFEERSAGFIFCASVDEDFFSDDVHL